VINCRNKLRICPIKCLVYKRSRSNHIGFRKISHAVQEIAVHIEIIKFILKSNLNIILKEKFIHVSCRLMCSVTNHYEIRKFYYLLAEQNSAEVICAFRNTCTPSLTLGTFQSSIDTYILFFLVRSFTVIIFMLFLWKFYNILIRCIYIYIYIYIYILFQNSRKSLLR
jgi:hypothetical protein